MKLVTISPYAITINDHKKMSNFCNKHRLVQTQHINISKGYSIVKTY